MGDFDFNDGIESGAATIVVTDAVKLQCINRILESIGEYPVDDVNSTNPDVVQANAILSRVNRQIQAERWHFNHRRHVVLLLPTDTLEVSGGLGTFLFDETVSETVSGATGTFKYILDGVMSIVKDDGSADFVGNDTITGTTTAATRDTVAHATVTTARHATNQLWLRVDSSRQSAFVDVTQTGQYLYNKDQNTFDFTAEITVDYVLFVPLENTPIALVDYVCAQAAREFQQATRNGQVSDGFTSEDVFKKRVVALHADAENEDNNILRERWALQVLGDRRRDVLDHLSR